MPFLCYIICVMSTRATYEKARAEHRQRIRLLQRRIDEIVAGAASASVSSGGGSKSYTNHQIAELRSEIERHQREIAKIDRALSGGLPRHVFTVRS